MTTTKYVFNKFDAGVPIVLKLVGEPDQGNFYAIRANGSAIVIPGYMAHDTPGDALTAEAKRRVKEIDDLKARMERSVRIHQRRIDDLLKYHDEVKVEVG